MREFVSFLTDMDDKVIGVLEEWSREMLIERTNAGFALTVTNGTKLVRKSVPTQSIRRKVIDLI